MCICIHISSNTHFRASAEQDNSIQSLWWSVLEPCFGKRWPTHGCLWFHPGFVHVNSPPSETPSHERTDPRSSGNLRRRSRQSCSLLIHTPWGFGVRVEGFRLIKNQFKCGKFRTSSKEVGWSGKTTWHDGQIGRDAQAATSRVFLFKFLTACKVQERKRSRAADG